MLLTYDEEENEEDGDDGDVSSDVYDGQDLGKDDDGTF